MPMRPRKPCSQPGCPELIEPGQRKCVAHRRQDDRRYKRDRNDDEQQRFYKSARWRRLRKIVLRRDPICKKCEEEGRTRASQEVHHKDGDHKNNEIDNLVGLCKSCHSREHGFGEG